MEDKDKLINRCSLVDIVTPLTCEHKYGEGQLPITICKSDVPCYFRKQTEISTYDKYNTDVTNIKTEEEVTA